MGKGVAILSWLVAHTDKTTRHKQPRSCRKRVGRESEIQRTLTTAHLFHSLLPSSDHPRMKLFFATLLLCTLLLSSSFLEPAMAKSGFCTKKCANRCSKAAVQDRCKKYCGICCEECKCVPSGTYGNKHECPCYRDKKNNKGKPKCP
ncbi:snakin-1 [Quercus suber]|uniref:Snakin-1 n=2 Tax=Quercus TaxID=3511 RepID=A0AAW0IXU3_QUESU